jgi:hypothetical protein
MKLHGCKKILATPQRPRGFERPCVPLRSMISHTIIFPPPPPLAERFGSNRRAQGLGIFRIIRDKDRSNHNQSRANDSKKSDVLIALEPGDLAHTMC